MCDPPEGAPNVLVVLIDDVGFGASSAFCGPCATPTAERLARGLKFNRFHTTAVCSPTRAALLSGRNHHTVGMGGITEIATSARGYNSTVIFAPAHQSRVSTHGSPAPNPRIAPAPIRSPLRCAALRVRGLV
jgi:arylsulfatase A-like enzyme